MANNRSTNSRAKVGRKERERVDDISDRHERARVRVESALASQTQRLKKNRSGPRHLTRAHRVTYDRALLDSLLVDLIPLYFAKFRTLGAVAKFLSAPSRSTIDILHQIIDEDGNDGSPAITPGRIAMMETVFDFATSVHESYGQSPEVLQPYLVQFLTGQELFGRPHNQPRLVSRTSIEKLLIDVPEFRDHMLDVYEEIVETLEERAWQRALHAPILVDKDGDPIPDPTTGLPVRDVMGGDAQMLQFLLRSNRPDKYRENNPGATVNVAFLQNGQPNPNYNPNAVGTSGSRSGQKFIVAGQEVNF